MPDYTLNTLDTFTASNGAWSDGSSIADSAGPFGTTAVAGGVA